MIIKIPKDSPTPPPLAIKSRVNWILHAHAHELAPEIFNSFFLERVRWMQRWRGIHQMRCSKETEGVENSFALNEEISKHDSRRALAHSNALTKNKPGALSRFTASTFSIYSRADKLATGSKSGKCLFVKHEMGRCDISADIRHLFVD